MSSHIDPRPRHRPGDWIRFKPTYSRRVDLPDFRELADIEETYISVLDRRRSVRTISRSPFRTIARWLSICLRARMVVHNSPGQRMHRSMVSAGALHPIEVVLVRGSVFPIALHYDPMDNALGQISSLNRRRTYSALDACRAVLPDAKGDFVFLLGSAVKTAAYYSAPESLLWRDAGAAIQTLAMTAAALNLAFCPLGTLGGEIIPAIGANANAVLPVGVCAVGTAG